MEIGQKKVSADSKGPYEIWIKSSGRYGTENRNENLKTKRNKIGRRDGWYGTESDCESETKLSADYTAVQGLAEKRLWKSEIASLALVMFSAGSQVRSDSS